MQKIDPPIIVEQTFKATPTQLWGALTDLPQMQKWYFPDIPDFKAEVGFKTSFAIFHNDRTFTHLWEVTEVIPSQKISYNWKHEEYPGDSYVTFEIIPVGENTILKLFNKVTEDFPQDIPEFKRESGVEGWNYLINESLKKYIENLD